MPPVAAFAIAFVAGLLAGRAAAGPAAAAALIVGALAARRAPWLATLTLATLCGVAYAAVGLVREGASCASRWPRGRRAAIVRLADAPDGRGLAVAEVRHAPDGCGGRLRLRLAAGTARSGATLAVVGQHVPGAALRVERFRVLGTARPLRFRVRDGVARRISALYGPRAALVDALVLGRRGEVDPRLRGEFVAAGLAHLLAISGLHVGIVAAWLAALARIAGAGRLAPWCSVGGTWAYAALLGFPAPATRAATFVAIEATARARQRHPRAGAVLAVAVLAVLMIDPDAVRSPGAWLSVAAVWGTGEAAGALRRLRRRPATVRLLAVSLGAVAATAPLTAYLFGQVAIAGVFANLLAVPLAGAAVPGILASLVVGELLAGGAGVVLSMIEQVAALGARLPFGQVTGDPGLRFAAPWAAALAAAVWLVRRRPTLGVAVRRASGLLALAVWALLARDAWWRDRYHGLTVHLLAVGQGDAIALRSPRGRWILIDAGPRTRGHDAGRRVVAPFLRRQGVRSLDLLVVTHGDADHVGGAPTVLASLPVARVLEPGQPLGSPLYLDFLEAVDAAGAGWRAARRGDVIEWDGVRLTVLHPTDAWLRREVRPNENSVILLASYGAFDLLLTGDAGLPVEALLADGIPQVEVLKVGHHGSAGSTGAPLLAAAAPKAALVSVGRNGYGHPAPEVLRRLRERGIPVYRTDERGTVTVRSDGMYFEVLRESSLFSRARLLCRIPAWLPSRASSSSRNACTRRPRGSSRTSFTTWPSPAR